MGRWTSRTALRQMRKSCEAVESKEFYNGPVADPRPSRGEPAGVRVGSVVVDCNDFPTMLAFWQEALRYVPREPAEDGWVVLRDPEGRHVNVSLQKVPEKRVGKNRLHFDLYTPDQKGEVERLL